MQRSPLKRHPPTWKTTTYLRWHPFCGNVESLLLAGPRHHRCAEERDLARQATNWSRFIAKHAIGTALATLEGVQVHLEPLYQLSSEDINITIVSQASQDSQASTLPLVPTEDDSAADRTTKLVQKHLNAVPLVLSIGGMMETDARDALKLWNSIMTGGPSPGSLPGAVLSAAVPAQAPTYSPGALDQLIQGGVIDGTALGLSGSFADGFPLALGLPGGLGVGHRFW
ncbi:hypothetical protein EHS25_002260 [Saitozyma podzolica]|uniref:Uncharacterized protein n=1 Tax=Saitozyma podzolica TaxID=1890683 RepID=A0A427YEV0_9TREE|nr:hypothetical protein EHS25_002260 [Saitozyma podzolica]